MSRKVLLSFLGTNRYLACNYVFPDGFVSRDSRFIQRSVHEYLADRYQWTTNDVSYLFLTQAAHDKNWQDENWENHPAPNNVGLAKECQRSGIQYTPIGLGTAENPFVPEGTSQSEIFDIFTRIEELIKPGDEVFIDITHGFRSLPMLFMVLINYIKVTKEANVRGVFYGAFEKLGPASQVKDLDLQDRNAPVLDLLPLVTLLEWGQGADAFLRYGYADGLVSTIEGHDHHDGDITDMQTHLRDISSIFKTTRGKDIIDGGVFIEARRLFRRFVERRDVVPEMVPLKRIVEKIAGKLAPFEAHDVHNIFKAVAWLEKNHDLQQMMTLVREGIVSIVEADFEERLQALESRNQRALIEESLSIVGYNIKKHKWRGLTIAHEQLATYIQANIQQRAQNSQFAKVYCRLGELRNDMNHAGFRANPKRAKELKNDFFKYYAELQQILTD